MLTITSRTVAVLCCLSWAAGALAADWPTVQQNNRRTGYTPEVIAPPYTEVWRHDFEEMIDVRVQPIVANGVVLVATYKGRLHGIDPATGDQKWVFQAGGPLFSSPSIAGGRAFLSCQDRFIYAIDMASGKEAWRFETGEGVWASPAVEEGIVYVGSRDGIFYALSADTGKELWRFAAGGPIETTAAIDGDRIYFGCEDMFAYALDRKSGKPLWKQKTIGQSMRSYWPVISDSFVYFRTLPVRSFWQHGFNVNADMTNPDKVARVKALLEKDPFSQTFFAFDRDGNQTIFPVLWTAGGGTIPHPPVVLPDGRIATPAPTGERTANSGPSSVSIINEKTLENTPGYIRVIADESYGYSASGTILFSSHHDYIQYVDLSKAPDQAKNTVTILGKRDRPPDNRAPQWFGNHDNHPGWHAATLANGQVYYIGEGSWLFAFKGETR